jgi:hypothetical protein
MPEEHNHENNNSYEMRRLEELVTHVTVHCVSNDLQSGIFRALLTEERHAKQR